MFPIPANLPTRLLAFVAALLIGAPGAHADPAAAPSPTRAAHAPDTTAAFRAAHGDFFAGARRFTPMVEMRALAAKAETRRGDVHLNLLSLDIALPVPLSEDTFLIAGAFAHSRRYRGEGDTLGAKEDTVFGTSLRLGFGTFVTEDLLVQALWQPSILSDFDATLHGGDWYLANGMALATWRASDRLYLKGGLAVMDSFKHDVVVPVAGVSWLFAEDWRLDVLLPRSIEVSWAPVPDVILHGGLESEGGEYRLHSSEPGSGGSRRVDALDHRLFAGAIFRVTRHISLSVKAGLLVAGKYDWSEGTGHDYEGKLEDGIFAAVGVGWSF